jgi:hypothetical protein
MNRAQIIVAATLVCGGLTAVALAQNPAPPPMTSVLAGKKFTPPFKGQADVDFTKPKTTQSKDHKMVITTIEVKNNASGPLLRFTIDETWYDKAGGLVTGGKGVVSRIEPGEVATVKIETPYDAKMSANNYNFSHANGTVKPHRVDKIAAGGEAPAKETAAKKK